MPTQRSPSVHDPARTRDIARPPTAQKHHHVRDLVHLRDAAHGYRAFHEGLQGRVGGDGLGDHGGVDPGRAEAIGTDLVGGVVEGYSGRGKGEG